MKEIISADNDKIVYKENGRVEIFDRNTKNTLFISSYKTGEVCSVSPNGYTTYSTQFSNHLDWFPEEEQEKVKLMKNCMESYIRDGGNMAYPYELKHLESLISDIGNDIGKKAEKLTEQLKDVIDDENSSNNVVNISGSNYITVGGKHYLKPTGNKRSVSIVNNKVWINGKRAVAIEDQEQHSNYSKAEGYAVDNSRFPAEASCQDPIEKEKEIKLFDNVTYKGHTIPKCKGMICNSSGEVTNIVETKDKLYCSGFEFKNGKWIKSFKAKLKTLFK